MRIDVPQYIRNVRANRKLRHRIAAFLTAMSMAVSMAVFWQLRGVGTAMTDTGTCTLQEHTHSDECYEKILICTDSEHEHTDECYEKRLVCGLDEHKHSNECVSDDTADVETEKDWEKTLPEKLTDDVRENIALVAVSQLGYSESKKNYHITGDAQTKNGYTRYGQWYGSPYGEWNGLFTYFCMYYAGVDRQNVPYGSGIAAWAAELEKEKLLLSAKDAKLQKGDVLLIDSDLDKKPDTTAVITQVDEKDGKVLLETVQGDVGGEVAKVSIEQADEHIVGYVSLESEAAEMLFEQASKSGVTVNAAAKKGTFPKGTTMTVTDISDKQALETAKKGIGKDKTVDEAIAVDITFKDAKGNEIEPADNKSVKVQIKLPENKSFDEGEYSLLHVIDDNKIQKIENASLTAEGAEFETQSFSIFVLTRDKGYVEPGQLVMIGSKDKGGNSEASPYMIYVGETISLRYTGEYKDAGRFSVFGNDIGGGQQHIARTPDGHDSRPDGTDYVQASFAGSVAGKCRIVYLSDKEHWDNDHVVGDLWVQVVDPIYVKTYYGDKGKDYIKEYLGGYEWIDWVRDKNGYIQNTSGKPYTLRVGDVLSVRSNATGSFELQGDGSTYLQKIGEQDGYTLYQAIAATGGTPVELQHKIGNTINDRLYVKVMPQDNNGYTHCDMEIADDGKYTLTEFTETGKTEKVYKAYVTKINSDTILRDANGDEVKRMPVDAYRKLGEPGQTQYEMTSAYYVGSYEYLGDTSLLHLDEYNVYTKSAQTGEWVEWHPGDPKGDGGLHFDPQSHWSYQFDPNKVKSVDFNVQITLIPDVEITYAKGTGDTYTETGRTSIAGQPNEIIDNKLVHFEGQSLIDAINKCPLDNGLDFTFMPEGALVKLQAGKELTNVGVDAKAGQFEFELHSGSKTGEVVATAANDAAGKVTFPYLAFSEQDKGKTFTYYMNEVPDPSDENVETYDDTVHTVAITIGNDMSVTVKYDNGDTAPVFRNTLKEYTLPDTGGGGIIPHISAGTALMAGSLLLLRRKKRREAQ